MNRLSKNEEEIRKQLNEQEFAFDEAQWAGAEALLDREMPVERKKKKRFMWFWLLPLLALLGIGGWWAYSHSNELLQLVNGKTAVDSSKTEVPVLSENETSTDYYITEGAGDTNYLQENELSNTNTDDSPEEYTIQGGPPALMAAQLSKQNSGKKQTSAHKNGVEQSGDNSDTHNTKGTNSGASKGVDNNGEKKDSKQLLAQENGGDKRKDKKEKDNNGGGAETSSTLKPEEGKQNKQEVPPAVPTKGKDEGLDEGPQQPAPVAKASSPDKADSTQQKVEAVDTTSTKKNKKEKGSVLLKNSISPMIMAGYYRIINPTGNDFNIMPYYGLFYNRYLTSKLQLGLGLGYTTTTTEGLNKVYTSETYSFGVQRDQTIIGTQKLYYIDVPVVARYSPVPVFSLVGGFSAGYLVNTQNTIAQESYGSLTGVSSRAPTTANAYRQGITDWNWQWQLGVEGNFFKNRLHVGFLTTNGFSDITVNGYYNNSVFDRTRRIQLYIRYDVIRF